MSQSIEWKRIVPHTQPIVTLMLRPASIGRTPAAGLPARLLLCALTGLFGLLVVVSAAFDAASAGRVPVRDHAAFEQRRDTDPAASSRIERAAIDLDESAHHGRIAALAPRPERVGKGSPARLASDRLPGAADRALPERPPRA